MDGGLGVWDGGAGAVVVEVRGAVLGYSGYVGVVVVEQVREAGAYESAMMSGMCFRAYYCVCMVLTIFVRSRWVRKRHPGFLQGVVAGGEEEPQYLGAVIDGHCEVRSRPRIQ